MWVLYDYLKETKETGRVKNWMLDNMNNLSECNYIILAYW